MKKEQWLRDHIWGSFSILHYKLLEVVKFNSFKMADTILESNNLSWASLLSFQGSAYIVPCEDHSAIFSTLKHLCKFY